MKLRLLKKKNPKQGWYNRNWNLLTKIVFAVWHERILDQLMLIHNIFH